MAPRPYVLLFAAAHAGPVVRPEQGASVELASLRQGANVPPQNESEGHAMRDHYVHEYAAQYAPFVGQHHGNFTQNESDAIGDYYKHKYASQYAPFVGQQNGNLTQNESDAIRDYYVHKYAAQYAPFVGQQNGNLTENETHAIRDYYVHKYAPFAAEEHGNLTQNESNAIRDYYMNKYAGGAGSWMQYAGGAGGASGAPSALASRAGPVGASSQAGGAGSWMQYAGGAGQSGAPSASASGAGPDVASSQAAENPGGFASYIAKYVPQKDTGSYVMPWTQRYSDSTKGMESMYSGGAHGYDQYVNKYSAMAGEHPAEAMSPQQHMASQAAGRMQALSMPGMQAPGARPAAQRMPGMQAPGAQPMAQGSPARSAASVSLAETPQSTPRSVQLSLWVFMGLALPSAVSFASVLGRKAYQSRRQHYARDDGFLLMVDP